ncbi:phosphatidylserine/phosphatidylglycerophosphate/cardiolipin synthase [Cylindrospermum stagnale PCC 7417]|uniref:Cardiolipin synthase n=1 Tax=Cylindrospermum stagnale PCC 7417 TaxID=56107 RepID=K9WWF2_9NOST|nr:cardiolipin synthase [Cylindrospermum stagnale]AFZ23857.1 phosphatidylserine/phosphatidylglycerophosphate/cardiolipin synthase [Cylindrospermum stagnale PCC 7417]
MLVDGGILAFFSAAAVVVHILGIAHAAHAVMNVRSSQGAIAWGISLVTFPWLAIPLYWILGRTKFHGYSEALRSVYDQHHQLVGQTYSELAKFKVALPDNLAPLQALAEAFTGTSFTSGNAAELLINGQQTYAAMLNAIASATDYILLQSYIVADDQAGNEFKDALITKAKQGINIYFLYDEIGSNKLSRSYINSLQQNGIQASAFHTTKGRGNRLQLNFRNHRKILVVDGETAFVGGLNIGDEYLGKNPRLSPWRDTHMMLKGPTVQTLQATFLQDWYWAKRKVLEVKWQVKVNHEFNQTAFMLPTGPADKLPACNLFFVNSINLAQTRLWIASPYFVPDESTLSALKLAVMRGVDVRIILPNRADHLLVYLCSFSYYTELATIGIKLFRYRRGFMHQKIILIDDDMAGVGTTNLDNRSFFLNFEVMGFVTGHRFVESVEKMLEDDLAVSVTVDLSEYKRKPFWFKLAVRISRLVTPLL